MFALLLFDYEGSTDYKNKALIVLFWGSNRSIEQNLFGFQNEGRLWNLFGWYKLYTVPHHTGVKR